jgi:hypothetical protein
MAHVIVKCPVLQDPQQFALQFKGNFADLVKDKCSLVSQLESPDSVAKGSREGALHMTEKLALEKFARNRGTIHGN